MEILSLTNGEELDKIIIISSYFYSETLKCFVKFGNTLGYNLITLSTQIIIDILSDTLKTNIHIL